MGCMEILRVEMRLGVWRNNPSMRVRLFDRVQPVVLSKNSIWSSLPTDIDKPEMLTDLDKPLDDLSDLTPSEM